MPTGSIGLFGGTFDPIHNAHLRMAEAAAEQCRINRVLLIPASNPPHRDGGATAPYEQRFRMVQIAALTNSLFEPSRLEQGPGKSYSFDTVRRFLGNFEDPPQMFFIIGADAFSAIESWHRWRELAAMVVFAVVGRPGAEYDIPDGARIQRVDGVNLPISSSEIRSRLAAGEDDVDLPQGVLEYIRSQRLYASGKAG